MAQDRLHVPPRPTRTKKVVVRTAVAACAGLAAYYTNPVLAGVVTVAVSIPGAALMGAGYGPMYVVDALYKNNIAVAASTAAASGILGCVPGRLTSTSASPTGRGTNFLLILETKGPKGQLSTVLLVP